MKKVQVLSRWIFALVLGVWLAGCVSDGTARPSDYEYEPRRFRRLGELPPRGEAPARNVEASEMEEGGKNAIPEDPDARDRAEEEDSEAEVEEEEKKKRGGLFSWFSRKSDDESEKEESDIREEDAEAAKGEAKPEGEGDDIENDESAVVVAEADEKVVEKLRKGYQLKAGDRINVTLTGSGGLSEQLQTVIDEEGAIKLRYIGAVDAEGLTTTALEREIEAEYTDRQKIYKEVVARVVVPNTFYFIGGEVRQPGRFPLLGRVTLSQAIPAAGNFTEWANERKIVIARGNDRYVIDFREISKDPVNDVELQPGDVITVERRTFL